MNATPAKLVGLLSMLAGLAMIIAGALTWATVTSQLKDENITVPADASSFAGKQVAGPFTACSQAETIKKHSLHGSFLRASLFTSVASYGISALVMGLGLLSMLVGWALRHLAKLAAARIGDVDVVRRGATVARA